MNPDFLTPIFNTSAELKAMIESFDRESIAIGERFARQREELLKERAEARANLVTNYAEAVQREQAVGGPQPTAEQAYGIRIDTLEGTILNTQVIDQETAVNILTTLLDDRRRRNDRSPIQVTISPVQATDPSVVESIQRPVARVTQGPSQGTAGPGRTRAINFEADPRQMPQNSVAPSDESEARLPQSRPDDEIQF